MKPRLPLRIQRTKVGEMSACFATWLMVLSGPCFGVNAECAVLDVCCASGTAQHFPDVGIKTRTVPVDSLWLDWGPGHTLARVARPMRHTTLCHMSALDSGCDMMHSVGSHPSRCAWTGAAALQLWTDSRPPRGKAKDSARV